MTEMSDKDKDEKMKEKDEKKEPEKGGTAEKQQTLGAAPVLEVPRPEQVSVPKVSDAKVNLPVIPKTQNRWVGIANGITKQMVR